VTTTDPFATEAKPTKDPRKTAYNAAQTRLRQQYPDDYAALLKEELESRGLEYKPRLTQEERDAKAYDEALAKARAKAEALVAEFGPEVVSGIV
jgi:hypothetical protein